MDIDDEDGAFAPVSPLAFSTAHGSRAPAAATRLVTPAAWGALGDRLAGISLVAFDGLDFPFAYRVDELVADGAKTDSAIPEFLPDPVAPAECGSARSLAPGLVCAPWSSGAPVHALMAPDGGGAELGFGDGIVLSAFTRSRGRLDGRASGAFSFDGGSSFAAFRVRRGQALGGSERWRLDGSLTLAADVPRGFGVRRASMLEAGAALLSDWNLGVTHSRRGRRTRLSLSQPPRAESGRGRLVVPSGRREDRTRLYETHRFSLVPSHRQITLRLSHQRPLLGGDLVVSAHRTRHPGHAATPARHGAGVAWRRKF